jgi:hypothetical protein
MSGRVKTPFAVVSSLVLGLSVFAALVSGAVLQPPEPCPSPLVINHEWTADRGGATATSSLTEAERERSVNCFAWQTFIALNWPKEEQRLPCDATALPTNGITFGRPLECGPVVWETFRPIAEVFREDGTSPGAWPAPQAVSPDCLAVREAARHAWPDVGPELYVLRSLSKIRPDAPVLDTLAQARGALLVDQDGHYVRYDSRLNEVAFDYIANPDAGSGGTGTPRPLYEAASQLSFALEKVIDLPPSSAEPPATILLKSAWRELHRPADWARFKTSLFMLTNPETGECASAPTVMGLVGLHVVRKTGSMWQWMWATFEHVDNAPQAIDPIDLSRSFSFHNPACIQCPVNQEPASKTPVANPTPVQVVREHSIPQAIRELNAYAWSKIQESGTPDAQSIWLNYQLVNVTWPDRSRGPLGTPLTAPRPLGRYEFRSTGQRRTNNVTLETYRQNEDCIDCHTKATIALNEPTPWAADFSFMFSRAPTPTPVPVNAR